MSAMHHKTDVSSPSLGNYYSSYSMEMAALHRRGTQKITSKVQPDVTNVVECTLEQQLEDSVQLGSCVDHWTLMLSMAGLHREGCCSKLHSWHFPNITLFFMTQLEKCLMGRGAKVELFGHTTSPLAVKRTMSRCSFTTSGSERLTLIGKWVPTLYRTPLRKCHSCSIWWSLWKWPANLFNMFNTFSFC